MIVTSFRNFGGTVFSMFSGPVLCLAQMKRGLASSEAASRVKSSTNRTYFDWLRLQPGVWSRSRSRVPRSLDLARSRRRSPSYEGDSNFGPYLSHQDFCVILLQFIWLLCNLFYN